jgi:L-rhamnose mutarotase
MKMSLRKVLIGICASVIGFGQLAMAEKLEVFTWEPMPGKSPQLIQGMMAAAKIHNASGATVGIYQHDVGSTQLFDYVLRWDNDAAWAKTKASNNSEEWQAFWAQASENPSGKLIRSLEGYNMDTSVKAQDMASHGPYRVFIWRPVPGNTATLLNNFARAKVIHESLGARIDMYREGVGGTGNYHYLMTWDSWEAMAKFSEDVTKNAEFQKMMAESEGTAVLVQSIQGVPVMSLP